MRKNICRCIASLPVTSRLYKFLSRSYYFLCFIYRNRRFPSTRKDDFRDFLFYRQTSGKLLSDLTRTLSHKVNSKHYINRKLGDGYTLPTLHVLSSEHEVLSNIPMTYPVVIKPVHSSGIVAIINTESDFKKYQTKMLDWLNHDYFKDTLEENYYHLDKAVIVEPYISSNYYLEGSMHCLAGKVKVISLIDRFEKKRESFNRNMQPLGVSFGQGFKKINTAPIQCLNDLISKAEVLSAQIDYIRVDFYLSNYDFLFGEMTNFPTGGKVKFYPKKKAVVFNKTLFS
jgi:hypothetical protein